MRVTNNMMSNTMTRYLMWQSEGIFKVQEQISTQRKINRSSDNPAGMRKILDYRSQIATVDQYFTNIERGTTRLELTEITLDALNLRYPDYDPDKIINVKVRQIEKDGQSWIRTTVEDHGTGIPDDIQEQIFDPFFTTKDRATGTGLGLSISLGIAKDHHGDLTFENVENEFTRFYLDLPVDNVWEID